MMKCFFKCLFLTVLFIGLSVSLTALAADVYEMDVDVGDEEVKPEAQEEPSSAQMVVMVTTKDDSGKGSFREAVKEVGTSGVVLFDDSLNGAKIGLKSPVIINKPLTVDASSLKEAPTLGAAGEGSVLKIEGDDKAISLVGLKIGGRADGELVSVSGGNLSMENCQIIGNKNGRGMTVTKATVTMTGCTIGGNNSPEHGGGLFVGEGAVVKLQKCTVASNTSKQAGGGIIVLDGGSLAVNESTLTKNSAEHHGGGVHVYKANFSMSKSIVTANKANFGGGYSDYGSSEVSGSVIAQNVANTDGGGIFVLENTGDSILTGCIVGGNTANSSGGGIQVGYDHRASSMKINSCSISGNLRRNDRFAGGVEVRNNSALDIKNSTIAKNKGYGILSNGGSRVRIEHCTITENIVGHEHWNVGGIRNDVQLVMIRSIVLGNIGVADGKKDSPADIWGGSLSPDSLHNVFGIVYSNTSIPDAAVKKGYPKESVLGSPVLHKTITCAADSNVKIPLYYPLVTAKSEFTAIDIVPAEEYEYEFDEIADQTGKPRPVAFFGSDKNGDAGAIEMQPK